MKQSYGLQRTFTRFIREGIKDTKVFGSPMAVYEWLVREWGRPLTGERQRQAWLAAWAVSIDHGMVKL